MSVILSSSVPRITVKTFPSQGEADRLYVQFTRSTEHIPIAQYLEYVKEKMRQPDEGPHIPFLAHFFPELQMSYTPEDEATLLLYVLTNTDLYDGDPRIDFVNAIKEIPPTKVTREQLVDCLAKILRFERVPGWNAVMGGDMAGNSERFSCPTDSTR